MENIRIVRNTLDLDYVSKVISEAKFLAVDTETTGLSRFAEVVGVGIAVAPDEAYYIPIKIWNGDALITPWAPEAYEKITIFLKKELTRSKRLIMHNAVYDCKVLHNLLNTHLIDYVHCDTALLHHTAIDENPPHGLKELATIHLDPEANNPQEDLKASVLTNGGKWLASNKEMYKGDYEILGKYCAWDVLYTYQLYLKFIPEIEKQGLQDLWNLEVMPLLKVSYDMNTEGFVLDVPYFEQLRAEIQANVNSIEQEIFTLIGPRLEEYEYQKALQEFTITPRSALGKELLALGWDGLDQDFSQYKAFISVWGANKKGTRRLFNLDSNDDKAFLVYDVLGFECTTTTAKGKRAITKTDFDRILEENSDNKVISLLAKRAKEFKVLTTYVESFLEKVEFGKIYPSFNQIGTVSGRYSSSAPNFQNIPRDDLRIKKGLLPKPGYVFVSADQSALEARVYAFMSGAPGIKEVYYKGLDLYSKLAIDILGLEGMSANKKDSNYLGTMDKDSRQLFKAVALAVVYGSGAHRLGQMLKKDPEEAQEIIDAYLGTYPELKDYMQKSEFMAMKYGYVKSLAGRKKRFKYVHVLYNKYGMKEITLPAINKLWNRVPSLASKFESPKHLYRMARNELNLAKNFRIQSLAASVVNAGMINIRQKLLEHKLDAKVCLQVHDSITVVVREDQAEQAKKIVQSCMEHNRITELIDVPMSAVPVVGNNLSEDK